MSEEGCPQVGVCVRSECLQREDDSRTVPTRARPLLSFKTAVAHLLYTSEATEQGEAGISVYEETYRPRIARCCGRVRDRRTTRNRSLPPLFC